MNEFRRILVPLDGSSLAERAIPLATTLAQQFGGVIILIRVVDFPDPRAATSPPDVVPSPVMIAAYNQACYEAKSYLQDQQDKLHRQKVKVKTLLSNNSPAEKIIDAATTEEVDLIVMSTHGRGGLARWAFGSVADKVMRYGPCPVLVVRENIKTNNKTEIHSNELSVEHVESM